MSFDLAIWAGEKPSTDEAALETFQMLMETYEEEERQDTPDDRLVALTAEITRKYPDDDSGAVWAFTPLKPNGPLLHLNLRWGTSDEVLDFIVAAATRHGLVCFDPQSGQVISQTSLGTLHDSNANSQSWFQGAISAFGSGRVDGPLGNAKETKSADGQGKRQSIDKK